MKVKTMKIVTIVFTICLLFTMAVPAFASENYVIKAGTYRFNDVLTGHIVSESINFSVTLNYSGTDYSVTCDRIEQDSHDWQHRSLSYHGVSATPSLEQFGLILPASVTMCTQYNDEPGWSDMFYGTQTITIPNDTEVSAEFYDWFSANALKVADDNTGDNTPPGVPGTGVTTPTLPGIPVQEKVWYNGVLLPNIISVAPQNEGHSIAIITKDLKTGNFYLSFSTNWLEDYLFELDGYKCYGRTGPARVYVLVQDYWVFMSEAEALALTQGLELIWTNSTIYTDSSRTETFFPKAPATLEGVVTEQMMEGVLAEVLMVLPIGLTCLIGYLALRKALSIFRRILLQA